MKMILTVVEAVSLVLWIFNFEGTYVFSVTNNNAAPEVGLVLIEDGKDGSKPENHIADAYVSQMVKHGKTETSKEVVLKKGTYKYFCPFNKTPQYTLVVK